MKVKVEACWSGGDKYSFRLTLPDGRRDTVPGEKWTKTVATEALDLLENCYNANRRSVRFEHH